MPSTVLSEINQEFKIHGPTICLTAMCASGVYGLLMAKLWIDNGLADDVLVLTSDLSGRPELCKGFVDTGVLFTDAPSFDVCRPFQEGSRGFSGGEAAIGMLVSSNPTGAYATVLGGAMTHDGHHAISINADAHQVRRAFLSALADAKIDPTQITYMNAHGPGTKQCDTTEAAIFDHLFTQAKGLYSIKPLTGHCQAAAGAVELVAALQGLSTGVIPAPPKVAPGHPLLLDGATPCETGPVVKSSLGMGGYNAVIVLDSPRPDLPPHLTIYRRCPGLAG
jgi:3-oxoacyl-[acyl-carrier-protein] synthase II